MKKQTICIVLAVIVAVLYALPASAQLLPTLPSSPENAPVDGGLSLLVAAGVGYGARKLKEKRKK